MIKVVHRVNRIDELKKIPEEFGVEVDLRAENGRIILNHEAFEGGDDFEEYMGFYKHSLLVLNIKESGIEDKVIEIVKKNGVENYFLLDVEFPYIFRSAQEGFRNIALRYSEKEPIENVKVFEDKFDWIWIDTNTKLPLDSEIVSVLQKYKTCLVCPERWGRPEDIHQYKELMKKLNFQPTAVMTAFDCLDSWS
ncbi:hypothetical protein JKY72_03145 [Candidatus Gracilibacteria bacterium]|nr:hypothetical protein [Candidatus Gracilibacteria bacterium]